MVALDRRGERAVRFWKKLAGAGLFALGAVGFGLGAFEARTLITVMGGRLAVDSALGKGTTFTITLPAAQPAEEEIRKRA